MIKGLFGQGSVSRMLRGGLEEASATHRAIAQRVAGAIDTSSGEDFATTFEAQQARARDKGVDLEREMAALADTQLRYEADAKLLTEAYARLRAAMRSRG
jgi:flagellar basal body rod protein FlgB